MAHFLTLDIEDWFHANYESVDMASFRTRPSRLEWEVERLLEICDAAAVKSTCFVLGSIAETFPGLIKEISAARHEVASHGYSHRLVHSMTPAQFREDVKSSCTLLEDLTGERVSGFRAPSWSVRSQTLQWFYPALEELGLTYSTSVYPAHTFLYGIPDFPRRTHRPVIGGRRTGILEIPVPVTRSLGKATGFSGGFYFRFFPAWFIRREFQNQDVQGRDTFLYLHPREIDPQAPRLPLSHLEAFIHYHGVRNCELKLRGMLNSLAGSFVRMGDFAETFGKSDGARQ